MKKTTVYLPEELEARLNAEAAAGGVSKAELIRRGIALLLEQAQGPKRSREVPVFDSGRSRTPDEMDDSVYEHIKERAVRR
ncbi:MULTISPECIES: CopG family transcriptional regulator [Streptomyces]|uniref:ribbon-helix-helix domain-containing protein n=1 Tax=Streptomyces TaxID=1883 RepID=UPI000F77121F|nr:MULTISPECIES: CopG family transcriptional regulator [Streptomyces]MBT3076410.1 ribbon-helix-helix domain-containing protein [Streptomyces sp. COG21]MBT3079076.1 ribbon-helix-helix domain-containing protein [Streptomyces sp. COG20]MBT3087948.1 ribbon-helix-helix domain-containing protein [Streptomyces sp. CYG21]MBT3095282.1 ribbon-helix-helix domain-containing protein [Streptomyces sp. CBG30]MBT3107056.1 ribbon-helix-helix domain-containing protein [Streptomyces sp. COG19]